MLGTNQNQQMQDMMNQLMPKKKVEREVSVETARKILADDYADELIDQETAKPRGSRACRTNGYYLYR